MFVWDVFLIWPFLFLCFCVFVFFGSLLIRPYMLAGFQDFRAPDPGDRIRRKMRRTNQPQRNRRRTHLNSKPQRAFPSAPFQPLNPKRQEPWSLQATAISVYWYCMPALFSSHLFLMLLSYFSFCFSIRFLVFNMSGCCRVKPTVSNPKITPNHVVSHERQPRSGPADSPVRAGTRNFKDPNWDVALIFPQGSLMVIFVLPVIIPSQDC